MTLSPDPMDAFDAQLRDALRTLPGVTPPAGFARAVALEAERRAARTERAWLLLPGVAFVPAAWYASVHYGEVLAAGFAPLLRAPGGATSLDWIAVTAACLALSWVFAQVRPAPQR